MQRVATLLVLLGSLVLAGCAGSARTPRRAAAPVVHQAAASGCGTRPPIQPGAVGEIRVPVPPRIALGADHRIAFIHVPRGYRSRAPAPLVLEFHGAGRDATGAGYLRSSPLERLSDRVGFLDVFPQGLRYTNGNLGWNAYGPVLDPVAELPFVERLIARMRSLFCVDARRIYASGISNGANMVNYLACRPAERLIAAVAPVAGPMYGQDDGPCAPARPIPILDVHSVDDPVVPYAGLPSPPNPYRAPVRAGVARRLGPARPLPGRPHHPGAGQRPDAAALGALRCGRRDPRLRRARRPRVAGDAGRLPGGAGHLAVLSAPQADRSRAGSTEATGSPAALRAVPRQLASSVRRTGRDGIPT